MTDRLKIGVCKCDDNSIQFYMIYEEQRVCDVSAIDILEMADTLTAKIKALVSGSFDRLAHYSVALLGRKFSMTFVEMIEAATNFVSVMRWVGSR